MRLSVFDPGDVFEWRGVSWGVLDRKAGRVLALRLRGAAHLQFDPMGRNGWEGSALKAWLNGPYLAEELDGEALKPFRMYAGSVMEKRTVEAKVGLLGVEPYRRYSDPKRATGRFFEPDGLIYWTGSTCDGVRGDGLICLSGQRCPGMYLAAHEFAEARPVICLGEDEEAAGQKGGSVSAEGFGEVAF